MLKKKTSRRDSIEYLEAIFPNSEILDLAKVLDSGDSPDLIASFLSEKEACLRKKFSEMTIDTLTFVLKYSVQELHQLSEKNYPNKLLNTLSSLIFESKPQNFFKMDFCYKVNLFWILESQLKDLDGNLETTLNSFQLIKKLISSVTIQEYALYQIQEISNKFWLKLKNLSQLLLPILWENNFKEEQVDYQKKILIVVDSLVFCLNKELEFAFMDLELVSSKITEKHIESHLLNQDLYLSKMSLPACLFFVYIGKLSNYFKEINLDFVNSNLNELTTKIGFENLAKIAIKK